MVARESRIECEHLVSDSAECVGLTVSVDRAIAAGSGLAASRRCGCGVGVAREARPLALAAFLTYTPKRGARGRTYYRSTKEIHVWNKETGAAGTRGTRCGRRLVLVPHREDDPG